MLQRRCISAESKRIQRSQTAATKLLFRLGIRLQPFFLHLAQDVTHIVYFVPDVLTHIDGCLLLSGHRDAIARAPVELDDLFLM
jgi:hypothetical protein